MSRAASMNMEPPYVGCYIDLEVFGLTCSQGLLPFEQSWVGIVEAAVDWVRGKVAEIFFVQFAERSDEGARFVHGFRRESIGLIFVAARPPMGEG